MAKYHLYIRAIPGYQGFSIPEIIKAVGISKTSVHRIIKGKL